MDYVTDLHFHSKYSRAVSRDMTLPVISLWAKKKGLDILSTTDWTHPLWFREISNQLDEKEEGLYKIKNQKSKIKSEREPLFILSTEVSSIYSQGGKVRRIHNLIFAPNLETAEKINKEFVKRGTNLSSDGRPITGLSSIQVMELIKSVSKDTFLIPCHAWTPWFSLYGSNSGFDSIEECFGGFSKEIYAIETGLSSDPFMNWRIKELEDKAIVSFSDAHSPMKLGREATVFMAKNGISNSQFPISNEKEKINYYDFIAAFKNEKEAKLKIGYTIEFYPEEGKYHFTGHRNCKVVHSPEETKSSGNICPVCKRPLTLGVVHRVEALAEKDSDTKEISKHNNSGVKWVLDSTKKHPPFVKLVPLIEIIAESLDSTVSSMKSKDLYDKLCQNLTSELNILLRANKDEIVKVGGERVAEGVDKVRRGEIVINPGFDGEYGVVKIWGEEEKGKEASQLEKERDQLGIGF
jgi:uncharacterized protein (TIGR00375 family)